MEYEWIIENKQNFSNCSFESIQKIICNKIASIIIKKENNNCTLL